MDAVRTEYLGWGMQVPGMGEHEIPWLRASSEYLVDPCLATDVGLLHVAPGLETDWVWVGDVVQCYS